MKLGEFKVNPEMEEAVWVDKKRVSIFALPISFTKYSVTPTRILIQTGILNTQEEEIMLYRVRDTTLSQNLFERINGTGTLIITSTDATTPNVYFKHIKNPHKVKELLTQMVENNRHKNRVRTVEGVLDTAEDGIAEDSPSVDDGIFDA